MKKKFSRFLSMLLVVTMVLGMFPTSAFADTTAGNEGAVVIDDTIIDGDIIDGDIIDGDIIDGDIIDDNDTEEELGEEIYDNETLAEAINNAEPGATIVITGDDIYTLPAFSKNLTIKAAEDVYAVIEMSSAVTLAGANVTFENLTFEFASNSMYKGFHHVATETYVNCTIDGQMFTYGETASFTNCVFNTEDAANYNLWTYGSANVVLDGCTFNCAGKSVLVYNEGACATDLTVTDCDFIASAPVDGKAAIEIDTTLMPDGTKIQIDAATTAEGFAPGSVSGNPLWNDKKDQEDLEISVNGQVVWPVQEVVASITDADGTVTEYASLQSAIDDAEDGDEIVVLSDIIVGKDEVTTLGGKYDTIFRVAGKSVTIDLNGKDVSYDAANTTKMLVGIFSSEANGHLTLKDNVGDSTVEIVNGSDVVYGLLVAYDSTCSLTVENGNYIVDAAKDSLAYTGGDDNLIINGGYFYLGNEGTGVNNSPWIFNAGGQNANNVIVNGGTFNTDVNHQAWANEVYVSNDKALKDNGNGTWTVVEAAAYITEPKTGLNGSTVREVGYATFEEAYAAVTSGETLTLLDDVTLDDVLLVDKSVAINGNGHNLTSAASRVIRVTASDVEVSLNDLNMVSNAVRVGTADIRGISVDTDIANVALTLNNCTVDFTDASANDWAYGVNICGDSSGHTIVINGGSYEGANAINIWGTGHDVTVDGATVTSTYVDNEAFAGRCICLEGSGITLTAKNNTFNGTNAVAIAEGTAATGNTIVEENNIDNTSRYEAVAMIGDVKYPTLQAAIDAAVDGDTITLIKAVEENVTITQKAGVSITLDGAGNDYTGKMSLQSTTTSTAVKLTIQNINFAGGRIAKESKPTTTSLQNLTIKDCTFDGNGSEPYALLTNYVKNLTVEDCTVKNYAYGFLYANKSTTNIVVRNVDIENCGNYGAYVVIGNTSTFEDVTIKDCPMGLVTSSIYNHTVTIKDCEILADEPLATVGNGTKTNIVKFEGVNDLGLESLPSVENMMSTGAVAIVGTKIYSSLADAVAATNAGGTVTLLADATGAGIVIDKDITIDLGGFTYTVNKAVGSAGTETLGFQLLKGNNVTLKNGTIAATETVEGKQVKMLVQNYANLTLEDITLDGTGSAEMQYVLSNNSGDVAITGATNITAPEGAVAFDVYDYSSAGYAVPSVAVTTTGTITGAIEVSETATLAISSGTFTTPVAKEWCAEGYVPVDNGDGTYGVKEAVYVAQIGDQKYETLQAAIDAVKNGETVVVLKDLAEDVTVKQKAGVSFTIDGNNTQYSGMITVYGMNRAAGKETLDIKNFNFVTEEDGHTFIYAYDKSTSVRYPHNITVDSCTFTTEAKNVVGLRLRQFFNVKVTNTTSKGLLDLVYAYNGTGPLTIDNVNIEGVNGIFFGEAKGLKVSNSTIKAENAGLLGRVTAGSLTVDNCNIEAYVPIQVHETNANNYTLNVNVTGANTHIVGTNENGYWGGLCDGLDADDNMIKPHSTYVLNLGEDVNLEEVKFFPVKVKEDTVAMIGDVQYDTLDKAFAAAVEGDTVVLVKDCAQYLVVVPAGVTFDLNGHYVTADNFLSFGEVKDDAEVAGGVVIDVDTKKAFTKIQEDNKYLPIYDTTAGCYRFFSYQLVNAGGKVVADNAYAVRIGLRLFFDNDQAYDVLATTTNSAMDVTLTLTWGTDVMIQHTFDDATVKNYATSVVGRNYDASSLAMVLTVKSLETLNGAELFAKASLSSVTEVVYEGENISVYK